MSTEVYVIQATAWVESRRPEPASVADRRFGFWLAFLIVTLIHVAVWAAGVGIEAVRFKP